MPPGLFSTIANIFLNIFFCGPFLEAIGCGEAEEYGVGGLCEAIDRLCYWFCYCTPCLPYLGFLYDPAALLP